MNVLYAHKLTTTEALLKNLATLKVLVWSRGRLVTLQILDSSSISLVEEAHGFLGQCVFFFLIDVEWFHCLRSVSSLFCHPAFTPPIKRTSTPKVIPDKKAKKRYKGGFGPTFS